MISWLSVLLDLFRIISSESHAVRFIANYGVFVGRMFSTTRRNAFFCCSRFQFVIDDIMRLAPADIYKYFHSFISSDLISTTLVLLELTSVRDGAFCFDQFDSDLVRSVSDCICRL